MSCPSRRLRRKGGRRADTLAPPWTWPHSARESRVLIVAGKGGVGKTTICAALRSNGC